MQLQNFGSVEHDVKQNPENLTKVYDRASDQTNARSAIPISSHSANLLISDKAKTARGKRNSADLSRWTPGSSCSKHH